MNKSVIVAVAAATALASGIIGIILAGEGPSLPNEMVVVSWGGEYAASQKNAYQDPYVAKTGITIINVEGSSTAAAKLRAMNAGGYIDWDLVDVTAADAIRLCDEGLAIRIDADQQLARAPDGMPASKDFGETLVSECFIPQVVNSMAFGYRTDLVGDTPPASVCDVFDTERYAGKRALERTPKNNMEWALLCDGVAKQNIYDVLATPAGQQRALDKLGTIKDEVIWWSASSQTPRLLAEGEVVMGSTYNHRLFSAIEAKKQPIGMLWDAQVLDYNGWIIPSGLSPARQFRALKFVKFATDTQRLSDQARWMPYAPARESSAPLVGRHAELGVDMVPYMPTDRKNVSTAMLTDYEFWATHRTEITNKFLDWLTE